MGHAEISPIGIDSFILRDSWPLGPERMISCEERYRMSQKEAFESYRARMNQRLTELDNRIIKRVFSVDSLAYEPGALDRSTKELIGLVASLVLRCDDCVRYHLIQLDREGPSQEAIIEALGIGLVVGGTIVIPHLRRAIDYLDELKGAAQPPP